jgi:hypothetical protein
VIAGFCVLRWVKLLVTCTGAPPGGHCGPAFTTPPFLPKPNGPSGFFVPTVDRNVVGVWNFTVILMDVSNRVNDTAPHQVQIVVVGDCGTAANYQCSPQPWLQSVELGAATASLVLPYFGTATPSSVWATVECKSPPYEARSTASCPQRINTTAAALGTAAVVIPSSGRNALGEWDYTVLLWDSSTRTLLKAQDLILTVTSANSARAPQLAPTLSVSQVTGGSDLLLSWVVPTETNVAGQQARLVQVSGPAVPGTTTAPLPCATSPCTLYTGTDTTFTLPNATPNAVYYFQILTTNTQGDGPFSDRQSFIPTGPTPATPLHCHVSSSPAVTESSFTFQWDQDSHVADGESSLHVSSWAICLVATPGGPCGLTSTFAATQLSASYSSLPPNTNVTVGVAALSRYNVYSPYCYMTILTKPHRPDPPPQIVVTTIGITTASCTISSRVSDFSRSIDSYILFVRLQSNQALVNQLTFDASAVTSTGMNVDLTGLTSVTQYSLTLQAVSRATGMSSDVSAAALFTTLAGVPDPPKSLTAAMSSGAAHYGWAPPTNTGGVDASTLTYYLIIKANGVQIGQTISTTALSYVLSSTYSAPGTTFSAEIWCTNSVGPSTHVTFSSLYVANTAPQIVSAVAFPAGPNATYEPVAGSKIVITADRVINTAAATSQVMTTVSQTEHTERDEEVKCCESRS